jgi:hypothetical protein
MEKNNWFNNIVDEDFLRDNLTFMSLYIAVYENFTDYVISNIESFLCEESIENGEYVIKKTQIYRDEIKNRPVDDKNNRDITKASFLWLKDNGAISDDDYNTFLKVKKIRNKYAHDLANILIYGSNGQVEIKAFFDLINLYKKIAKWWYINIEAEIMGYQVNENAEIHSASNIVFDIIIDVLYNGKSEEYKRLLENINKEQ